MCCTQLCSSEMLCVCASYLWGLGIHQWLLSGSKANSFIPPRAHSQSTVPIFPEKEASLRHHLLPLKLCGGRPPPKGQKAGKLRLFQKRLHWCWTVQKVRTSDSTSESLISLTTHTISSGLSWCPCRRWTGLAGSTWFSGKPSQLSSSFCHRRIHTQTLRSILLLFHGLWEL